jgi:DNA-binding winged helix-turn-helix (wHTH) protein
VFQTGGLSVDLVKRIVKVDAISEVKLSPKEYDILRVLVQHAGKVLTHQFLLKQVWGNAADVQYLRVYVRQLRQKIELKPDQPQYITTETGVGYRLREADGRRLMALATAATIKFMMMVKKPKNRHTASATDAPPLVISPMSRPSCRASAAQATMAVIEARPRCMPVFSFRNGVRWQADISR